MTNKVKPSEVKEIVIACEAGMGSSLMSVNALKKKFKKAGIKDITIHHKPARDVSPDTKVIMVHKSLAAVAQSKAPGAVVLTFNQFLNDPAFDKLVKNFLNDTELVG